MKNFELAYMTSNLILLPAWLMLIVAPNWRWTDRLVHRIWIPALYCTAVLLILVLRPKMPEGASIATFQGFMLVLDSPFSSLAIWIQLVIWDLFIGAWESRDARRLGIHPGWMVLPLFATFLFGPPGLLLYFAIRYFRTRNTSLVENVQVHLAPRAEAMPVVTP